MSSTETMCPFAHTALKELIGMRSSQFDRDSTPEKICWLQQRLRKDGSVTHSSGQRKDGSLLPVKVRTRALNRGGRLFSIALASDITNRRRHEQRLLAEFSVTQTHSEAGSIEEAAPRILREMCEALEWDCGRFIPRPRRHSRRAGGQRGRGFPAGRIRHFHVRRDWTLVSKKLNRRICCLPRANLLNC